MKKLVSLLLLPAFLLAAFLAAPAAARGSRLDYPDAYGGETVVSQQREEIMQLAAWVGGSVMGIALLGGVCKLLFDLKSVNTATRRPRKPWELLP